MVNYREKMERLNSGDWKMIFGINLRYLNIGLMMYGRAKWQVAEATRKDFSIVLILQEQFCTSELFKGHSGRSLIDPTLLDNVINSEQVLRVHLSYRMCSQFTLIHKFRIDTGRTKFKQGKTDSILWRLWIPWTRFTKIRMSLTWPNHVLHHRRRKRGKDTKTRCIGSIYSLLNGKDWSSIQTRSERNHSLPHTPSSLYTESRCDGIWRNIYEKVFMSPRPPPTISFKDNWMKELDPEVAGSRKYTQRIQPKPKTNYGERRDPRVNNRRSKKMSYLVWKAPNTQQERRDPWMDNSPSSSRQ